MSRCSRVVGHSEQGSSLNWISLLPVTSNCEAVCLRYECKKDSLSSYKVTSRLNIRQGGHVKGLERPRLHHPRGDEDLRDETYRAVRGRTMEKT